MHLAPAGDRAVLIELGDVSAAELHAYAASARALADVLAVMVGHSSLYVVVRLSGDQVVTALHDLRPSQLDNRSTRQHHIPVSFTSEDLPEFLARTNLTREQFLQRLPTLTARYLGFRAGFAYLDGWPKEWAMPRRPTSRPVPRGSFAIGGNVAGFYPIDSPGGWNLLGRTDVDLEHAIAPGDEIVLVAVGADEIHHAPARPKPPLQLDYADILSAPLATLVGAPDWSRIDRGISPGGWFDDIAAPLANRAVGNPPDAPLLECAMTGPRLRFRRDCVVAWCGEVRRVRAGEEVAFGRVTGGLRGYLAVGEREGVVAKFERGDRHVIRAMRGPYDVEIGTIECEVTPAIDRVGIRLHPLQSIDVRIPADLKSSGMQCGTVQLHPDGSLVAMGPDHPITGGYLQPMTVLWEERWKLAQLMPGERMRFVLS